MKKFFKENQKGFTLIELLVVIAILAVLATLYVPKIVQSTANAKKTVEIANARTLASEITTYNATKTTKDDIIIGTGSNSAKYTFLADHANWTVVEGTETKLISSNLLDGRTFPDTTYVYLITDNKTGSCFIVDAAGSPITATE